MSVQPLWWRRVGPGFIRGVGEDAAVPVEQVKAALGPAVRPVVAGDSGVCRLKMNCRPSLNYMSSTSLLPLHSVSTVAFRFHSKFQFRQLSSESTVL